MNKKRVLLLGIILSVCMLPLINLVSAQYYYGSGFNYIDLGEGMRQIIDQITRFLTPVLEIIIGDYQGSEFFFAKVMVLILMTVVIYWILERTPALQGYRNISMIISLVVSIMAVRFISDNELINGILLPYGTLGVALTTLLPFLIFAYGIHTVGLTSMGRKISWFCFSVIFFILWIYKSPELSQVSNQIYLWTTLGMILMLIFDRTIHAYLAGADIKRYQKDLVNRQVADLQVELSRLRTSPAMSPDIERRIRQIERQLRHLRAREAGM